MDQIPLVNERIDAGARFLREFQKVIPIQSAFWVKEYDVRDWYLYVASDQITDENLDTRYDEVIRVATAMRDPQFDLFRVKLIGADHRLAKKAAEMHRQRPGWSGYSDSWPSPAEDVYLYPSPLPVPVA
jgi:hypothetical protein